ncbi:hypothetical protein CDL15_Pgr013692 [Punica granatum]|uniref:Peptidase A1 domain-containing protein n=1 Tax=Punica granatum TaxID=22663 RepID=A0A218W151_PUNGR|nr:hypothetical protein CDL15_Pgr013692 [Punica granatum]
MRPPFFTAAAAVLVVLSLLGWGLGGCRGRIFSFEMHHRFSDPVRRWSQSAGKLSPAWPEKGSYEYYAELARRDRAFRGRGLAEIDSPLAFSDGNSTIKMNSLGFLHYTTVQLGTPGTKFLVALDTGSDLFWVPCDCSRCAPTETSTSAFDFVLSTYKPEGSSTSKRVTCSSSLCLHRDKCLGTSSSCPYTVSYVSAETSTSGVLVEDVLHLTTEGSHRESVEAYIMFGCGQVQTGSFLDVAAPNGLFGLGMEQISVPSILSREGFMADSFSMCFGRDGVGRINFGDKGSIDQDETPFNFNPLHPTYNISVTQIRVGMTMIDVNISALFDSGTSFTYMVDPLYSRLVKGFHSQVQDRQRPPDSRIPFEYCYDMSPDANSSLIPSLSLTMKGGSLFEVHDPLIVISTQTELVYCLAVVKNAEMNIIGQNFMTGYRVVFDREKLVLGWKNFDCYDMEDLHNSLSIGPHNTNVPPAIAAGLDESSSHKSAGREIANGSQSSSSAKRMTARESFIRYFPIVLLTIWQTILSIGLSISSDTS